MLFDVQAALAEILSAPPDTFTASAPAILPAPQLAEVGAPAKVLPFAPPPSASGIARRDVDTFPHGHCPFTGDPRTWTGKVVSLDAWRSLSEWDRHGSTGKLWNGLSRQWEPIDGGAA